MAEVLVSFSRERAATAELAEPEEFKTLIPSNFETRKSPEKIQKIRFGKGLPRISLIRTQRKNQSRLLEKGKDKCAEVRLHM